MHRFNSLSAASPPRPWRPISRWVGGLIIILTILLPISLFAESLAPTTEALIRVARERHLSASPYWHTLLHSPKGAPYASLIDDPAFFLAEGGKTDAEAELNALIRTFFNGNGEKRSVCPFIARYTWVREQLADILTKAPLVCEEAEGLSPSSATLIFPTYHLNNPASMFGHTFLTIETAYQSPILADAVNYAALPDSRNPITYMFKGIAGSFKGYYSILPYYKKIREYGEMAQRDIWEYPLTLTPEETRRMVLHILELKKSYSRYYFFDKNCSYMLQFLLESARPSVSLTQDKGLTVIPIDTIKMMKKEGLIGTPRYRPSMGSRIQAALGHLSPSEVTLVQEISEGKRTPKELLAMGLTEKKRRRILDTIILVTRYRRAKKKLSQGEFRTIFLNTLKARKGLGVASPDENRVPAPLEPTTGHDAARISIAAGVTDTQSFEELTLNPSFTTLITTDHTKREGVQIEFFTLKARLLNRERELSIQRATLLDIVSLSPRGPFIRPLSWTFHTGYEKRMMKSGESKGAYSLRAATGMAWNLSPESLLFCLPEAELLASEGLDKGGDLGVGLYSGLLFSPGARWRALLSGHLSRRLYDHATESRLSVESAVTLRRNDRIGLRVTRTAVQKNHSWQTVLSWHHYF